MRSLLTLALGLLLVSTSSATEITVAAAISLKESLNEISKLHESRATGDKVSLSFGASGQLMAQVKGGAPIDIFISAANKQVDELSKDGLIDDDSRRVIARNRLVLIVPSDSSLDIKGFSDLASASIKRLAIGEPTTVPAGMYASQALRALKVDTALKDRIAYGSNVRQVLDYVERGEVSAGIVYQTDAIESQGKVKVIATADESLHQPIEYTAVIVRATDQQDSARAFVEFLASEPAQRILASKGFVTADDAPRKP